MDYKDTTITKTEWDGKAVTVDMTIGSESQTIKGMKRPHSDLVDALDCCVDVFMDHMEIPVRLGDRISVVSVQYKETSEARGYVINALLHCPGTKAEIKMRSSFLGIPRSPDFFWLCDYAGDVIHDPEDYLYLLTDDEISKLDKVLKEGYLYAKEGKAAPDPQPDLFGGEMEAEPMPADAPQLEGPEPLQLECNALFLGSDEDGDL